MVAVSVSSFGYECTTNRTLYMAVPIEQDNSAVSFEQNSFREIDEAKIFEVSCLFRYYHVWTARISTRAVRKGRVHTHTHTATHRETDYCNPAAHAQRVNKLI